MKHMNSIAVDNSVMKENQSKVVGVRVFVYDGGLFFM